MWYSTAFSEKRSESRSQCSMQKYQYFVWGSTLNLNGFKIIIFQCIICEPFRSWKEGSAKLDVNPWGIWRKFKCRRSMFYPPAQGRSQWGGRGGRLPPRTPKIGKESKNREGEKGGKERKKGKEEKREERREKEKRKGKRKRGRKREKGKERKREEKKGEKGRKGGEEKGEEREEKRKKMLNGVCEGERERVLL